MSPLDTVEMIAVEAGQMSSFETAELSAVETGQMSAGKTIQMSSAETRQMHNNEAGRSPISPVDIRLFSTEDMCLVLTADICPVSTADICPVSTEDISSGRADVKAWLRREDFIRSIMQFDKDDIAPKVKTFLQANYLNDETAFDPQRIMAASRAAGPLALWVKSIVEYSSVFHSIAPLRAELHKLEEETARMREEQQALDAKITELESSIEGLKAEYATLIARAESIKTDMKAVQEKVGRSVQLLSNLSSERARWEESSKSFVTQMACLVGDCLFTAAFLAYIGFFDHYYRRYLQTEWRDAIDAINLKRRPELRFAEFLSSSS